MLMVILIILLAKSSGYMSPEYAMDGVFSVKSDVFSFGVLVLEIISGKKNRGVYIHSSHLNLLGHVSVDQIISSVGTCFPNSDIQWNFFRPGVYGTRRRACS